MVKKHLGPNKMDTIQHEPPSVVPQTALPGSTEVPMKTKKVKPSPKSVSAGGGSAPEIKVPAAKAKKMKTVEFAKESPEARKERVALEKFLKKEAKQKMMAATKAVKAKIMAGNKAVKQAEKDIKHHKKAVGKHHAKEAKSEAKLVKEAMKHAKHKNKKPTKAEMKATDEARGVSASQISEHIKKFRELRRKATNRDVQTIRDLGVAARTELHKNDKDEYGILPELKRVLETADRLP